MIEDAKIPILEYDNNPVAIIQPDKDDYDFRLPQKCIAIFFKDVVEALSKQQNVKELGRVSWETGDVVYYLYDDGFCSFAFYHTWVGAPISAAVMDLSIALGATTIISIGGCGVINKELFENNYSIVLPIEGIRDEGTSYHYIKPSQTIAPSRVLIDSLERFMESNKICFSEVKTWTTDGFYRETDKRTKSRRMQGCDVVEMEFTAMCSVAQKRGVHYAALFYCGDSVEYDAYDERDWQNNHSMRNKLFNIVKYFYLGGLS